MGCGASSEKGGKSSARGGKGEQMTRYELGYSWWVVKGYSVDGGEDNEEIFEGLQTGEGDDEMTQGGERVKEFLENALDEDNNPATPPTNAPCYQKKPIVKKWATKGYPENDNPDLQSMPWVEGKQAGRGHAWSKGEKCDRTFIYGYAAEGIRPKGDGKYPSVFVGAYKTYWSDTGDKVGSAGDKFLRYDSELLLFVRALLTPFQKHCYLP